MTAQTSKSTDSYHRAVTGLIAGTALFILLTLLIQRDRQILYTSWKTIFLPISIIIFHLSSTTVGHYLNILLGTTSEKAKGLVVFLKTTPVAAWHLPTFIAMNHFIGKYLLLIFMPMGVYLTVMMFRKTQTIGGAFRTIQGAKAFNQMFFTPTYRKFVAKRQMTEDEEGSLRPAMTVAAFCQQYQLAAFHEATGAVVSFDEKQAFSVFRTQLGERYQSKHQFMQGKYAWVIKTLGLMIPLDYRKEAIDIAIEGHLYETTAVLSLLIMARHFGVVSMQAFLALKPQDRALWYAMSSCGRKVCFIEGAGIMSQFLHEWSCKTTSDQVPQLAQVNPAISGTKAALLMHDQTFAQVIQSGFWADAVLKTKVM